VTEEANSISVSNGIEYICIDAPEVYFVIEDKSNVPVILVL
jgi:hypothetical protein